MSSNDEWRLAAMNDPEVRQRIKDLHTPMHEIKGILRRVAPKASETMVHRCAYNLVCHRKHIIAEWDRQRNGKLDQQLTASKNLKSVERSLAVLRQKIASPFGEALEVSGSLSKADALAMIEKLEAGALSVRRNPPETEIKSEGADRSTNLARKLLKEFLVVATVTWCQATGRLPRLSKPTDSGEPVGPCSRFYCTVTKPLIERLNANGAGIEGSWGAIYKRLYRLLQHAEQGHVRPDIIRKLPGLHPIERRDGKRKLREEIAESRSKKRKTEQRVKRK